MTSDAPMATGCAVLVLANEMSGEGWPTAESRLRLEKAVEELSRHPHALLVTSGWGYRDDTDATLADAMAQAAIRDFDVPDGRILRLHASRDTVGDAVFFARAVRPEKLIVVTSEYHRDRTHRIFRFVMGPDTDLTVIGVGNPGSEARQNAEANSLDAFHVTFEGIEPGDLDAIEEHLMTRHPFYNGTTDVKALRRHD